MVVSLGNALSKSNTEPGLQGKSAWGRSASLGKQPLEPNTFPTSL
jgi:hypothetical protein